jgi:pimeloyl-ACP methyl ester carboxylesterase
MSARVEAIPAGNFETADVPLWREALFGVDWLALRLSPVYYGIGVPRGDGAPVVVIPGFLGSDNYLIELYYWLRRIGYKSYYSRIGRNAECPDVLTDKLLQTMDQAQQETGRKVHLIGHSLGGLIARSAAGQRPEQVEQVITLASPFRDIRVHPMILAAAGFVRGRIVRERGNGHAERGCYTGGCTCAFATSLRTDPPKAIKRTAVYTKSDGVVDWRSCIEEDDKYNVKVEGTHSGLAFNPQVYRTIGKLLAPKKRRKRE